MKEEPAGAGPLRRRSRAVGVLVVLAVLLVISSGLTPASASGGGWHHEYDPSGAIVYTEVTEDTCDVPGLTVQLDLRTPHKKWRYVWARNGLPLYREVAWDQATYTNVDTGVFITVHDTHARRDLRVTDNGDGTSTVSLLVTGTNLVFDENGGFLDGFIYWLRIELQIDNGDTPKDPDDDDVIGGEVLDFGSTGDLCDSMVPALT
jgi:hypothetical protein